MVCAVALPGYKAAGYIAGVMASQVQPAGVDLRVESVFSFNSPGLLGVEKRVLSNVVEVPLTNGFWELGPGAYKVRFVEAVEVPLGYVGFCFPRSSLLRMGAYVGCAVWDPGYRGRGEALLYVVNPHGIRLEAKARIVQLVFIRMEEEPGEGYRGVYQGENL